MSKVKNQQVGRIKRHLDFKVVLTNGSVKPAMFSQQLGRIKREGYTDNTNHFGEDVR